MAQSRGCPPCSAPCSGALELYGAGRAFGEKPTLAVPLADTQVDDAARPGGRPSNCQDVGVTGWNELLRDQFGWHWDHQLRPRLEGLTDEEYLWEPVADAWSVRARGTAITSMAAGAGDLVIDWAYPEPSPAPFTTIAWRLGHVIVGVLGMRSAAHFGRASVDYAGFSYAPTAAGALDQLHSEIAIWLDGVRSLGEQGLQRPCGPAEGAFADAPLAMLVLHIHRELIHHLAEVSLLRDLYAHSSPRS